MVISHHRSRELEVYVQGHLLTEAKSTVCLRFFFVQNRRLTKRLTPPGFWKNLFSISSTPRKRSYGQFSSLTLNIPGLVKNNLITFYGERGRNCEDEMGVPRNQARWKNLFRALRPCHPSKNKDTFNINRYTVDSTLKYFA